MNKLSKTPYRPCSLSGTYFDLLPDEIVREIFYRACMNKIKIPNFILDRSYFCFVMYDNEIFEKEGWNKPNLRNKQSIVKHFYTEECYSIEGIYTIHRESETYQQRLIKGRSPAFPVPCSFWVLTEYRESQKRRKKMKEFWKRYIKNKQLKQIINVNHKEKEEYTIKQYNSLVEDIKDLDYELGYSKRQNIRTNNSYDSPIVDIYRLKRFIKLYKETKIQNEKMYYFLEAGRLLRNNQRQNENLDYQYEVFNLKKKKEINEHWGYLTIIGSPESHLYNYFDNLIQDQELYYSKKHFDYQQHLYRLTKYTNISRWDVYSSAFIKKYEKYIKY